MLDSSKVKWKNKKEKDIVSCLFAQDFFCYQRALVRFYLIGSWWFLMCVLAFILQEVENPTWGDVACVVVWICNARWLWVFGLIGRKCRGCIPECALSTCLTWCFLSLKLGKTLNNILELAYSFDLRQNWSRSWKSKLKIVLEVKCQVGFWKIPLTSTLLLN